MNRRRLGFGVSLGKLKKYSRRLRNLLMKYSSSSKIQLYFSQIKVQITSFYSSYKCLLTGVFTDGQTAKN